MFTTHPGAAGQVIPIYGVVDAVLMIEAPPAFGGTQPPTIEKREFATDITTLKSITTIT